MKQTQVNTNINFVNSKQLFIKQIKANYFRNYKNLELNLSSNNIIINKPMGGFYLLPEFLNKKFDSSSILCDEILTNLNIALLPGSDFGFDQNRMIVRLSFTDFDGDTFMKNINEKTDISDELIKLYAPKVVEGVNKLKSWVEK